MKKETKFIVVAGNGMGVQFVDANRWGIGPVDEADQFEDCVSAEEAIQSANNLRLYKPVIKPVTL